MPQLTDAAQRRRSPLGLRQRLLLTLTLPLLAVFALSVFMDYRLARQTTDLAYDQSLDYDLLDVIAHIQTSDQTLTQELSEEADFMLRRDPLEKAYLSVRDSTGKLIAGDGGLPFIRVGDSASIHYLDGNYQGQAMRMVTRKLAAADGDVTVTMAATTVKRERARRQILTTMILPNIALIIAVILAVYFGVRNGLKPLDQVERDIAARSPRDLRELEVETALPDIRPILLRLNQLFVLLREATASQQRFLADAAHQLRTPVAGLQAQLDLLTAESVGSPQEERLARIEDAIERINRLVSQLLTYAQAEPSASASQLFETVALHDLVEKSASVFIDRAIAKNIDLGFAIAPASAQGVPWMLREILGNLIDNALHYTPENGVVTVSSGVENGHPFIKVEDSGPGIPADEREKVFDRFYRIPGSPGGGCGLGLAIAREVAAFHDAQLQLSDSADKGLRVTLLFPTIKSST